VDRAGAHPTGLIATMRLRPVGVPPRPGARVHRPFEQGIIRSEVISLPQVIDVFAMIHIHS